jgi:hypothetical protein
VVYQVKGVFGFAFKTAFAFRKAKSQPNTLAFQSYFSTSTKLKAAPPAFACCGGEQLRKYYAPATLKKINLFLNFFTTHSPQQLFHNLQFTTTFSKITTQPNTL